MFRAAARGRASPARHWMRTGKLNGGSVTGASLMSMTISSSGGEALRVNPSTNRSRCACRLRTNVRADSVVTGGSTNPADSSDVVRRDPLHYVRQSDPQAFHGVVGGLGIVGLAGPVHQKDASPSTHPSAMRRVERSRSATLQ